MKLNLKRLTAISLVAFIVLTGCTEDNGSNEGSHLEEDSVEVGTEENEENLTGEDLEELEDSVDSDDGEADSSSDDDSLAIDMEEDLLNPDSIKVLVNKQYALPEGYAPEDLVTVDVDTMQENPEARKLRQVASDALTEMFNSAKEDGLTLVAISGYRSYERQQQIYNMHVERDGEEAANRYSARPGESEHQTGLAMDISSQSANYRLSEVFGDTPEGIWVAENAHHFGFIIRYPEGKESITGYQYEPWHLRYFGKELAVDIFESGLTYEEYLIEEGIDIETGD